MALGLLGKKVGMTQVYSTDGVAQPVTVIQAGPCPVTMVKTMDTDGYVAVQVGFDEIPAHKLTQAERGHLAKVKAPSVRHLKEYRIDQTDLTPGSTLDVTLFKEGDFVDVTGTSIGRGFAGMMKRHGTGRGPMAHGSKFHRHPGSIGAGTTPARVYKGKKMPGRLGNKQVTVSHLQIVKIDQERNLILVKGAVPGAENGLLSIRPAIYVGAKA